MRKTLTYPAIAILLLMTFLGCKKESFTTSAKDKLQLRTDTLWFDTVFTNVNSSTPKSRNKQFVIINPHDQKIKTSVLLAGGEQSHFLMNVDGVPGTVFTDLEIFPHDSLFVFVEVHPDPNNNSPDFNPLIIRDSILFNTNGNEQKVNLIGWGQDAHYIFRDSIESDTSWANDKLPIVVYGYLYVKPNVKLTIKEGMQIHFAPSSWLFVEGQVDAKGTADKPIVMQGDRLQPSYEEVAGQWGGIYINYPSKDNYLQHVLVKNAIVGVYCDTISGDGNSSPNVTIDQCFIRNMLYDGIASRYAKVNVRNTISSNCGRFTFLGSFGGIYDIRHCTFHTGSASFSRQDPTFALLNINRNQFGQILSEHSLDFYMANSIVWGSFTDGEIGTDLNAQANILFENNLLLTPSSVFNNNNNILNYNPLFRNADKYVYELDSLSPAKDKGKVLFPAINFDIKDNARIGLPDIGAYESRF